MSSFPCVHHVEVGVTEGPRAVNILRTNYTFDVVATRNSKVARQWLLVKNDTRFLVTTLKTTQTELVKKDNYVIDWMDVSFKYSRNTFTKEQRMDSVFNVCLQVDSIEQSMKRLEECGVRPFRNIKTISDSFGSVRIATIKSCVGDVYHTLIEKTNYSGRFLPDFRQISCDCDPVNEEFWTVQDEVISDGCHLCSKHSFDKEKPHISLKHVGEILSQEIASQCPSWSTFDHVSLAVETGTSGVVSRWYENCLGMRRFWMNIKDDPNEGLLYPTNDIRARAMEYWKCAETGLLGGKEKTQGNRLYIVIAEAIPPLAGSKKKCPTELWIREHKGPGIHHVAIGTDDIKTTVRTLRSLGATFEKPPPEAYYTKVGRLYDIQKSGEDLEALRQNGILIDTESDRYLLQIFSRPIFPKGPFLIEIIQREGATGFGSGNVTVLHDLSQNERM